MIGFKYSIYILIFKFMIKDYFLFYVKLNPLSKFDPTQPIIMSLRYLDIETDLKMFLKEVTALLAN